MASEETRSKLELEQGTAQYWHIELNNADKTEEDWRKRGRKVIERYRDERNVDTYGMGSEKKFNILWANTETLKGALFAKMAKPDVRRRFPDNNPVTKNIARVLERTLAYANDVYNANKPIESALEDYLLPGRGVVWVVYDPVFVKEMVQMEQINEMGERVIIEVEEERVAEQRCYFDYVHWEDYRENPAKRPEDVSWKARRHLWTRDELKDKGFSNVEDIPLDWSPDSDEENYEAEEVFKRAEVWEIWDRVKYKRYYVARNYDKILRVDDDPYELQDFFPTPTPMIAVRTNDTSVPIPEFTLYQDQAEELDRVTTRISNLIEGLKRRGVYDASVPELSHLANAGDNDFIPSENFSLLAQKGGLAGVFQQEDISPIGMVLQGLYQQRTQILEIIYEVTGISDLLRGNTKASETATAQQLKAQFGSMRMRKRQEEIERYIRDLFRIKAEIVAEHYEPEVLQAITNIQITPEMMQIMRDDKLREYNIDVETDSTVFADENAEKQTRIEFLQTMGAYLEKAIAVSNANPSLTPIMFQSLRFLVGAWKVGREFEEVIDQTEQQIMQQMQQAMQAPPQPSEAEKIAQAKIQGELMREKMKQEGKLADIQAKSGAEMTKIQSEAELSRERNALKEDLALLNTDVKLAEKAME
tara:strand:+ start:2475 stop:4412 length:1938 start_codon:yes stop_codon:yes gene_type:complete